MDSLFYRTAVILCLVASVTAPVAAESSDKTSPIEFDMPAVATAIDRPGGVQSGQRTRSRIVTIDLVLSSLVSNCNGDLSESPPIDHFLVRCSLRDRSPVVDYVPKTELQSDFTGPISITQKDEQSESFGFSLDGAVYHLGSGHLGADDSHKQSDSSQFQRQAPLQAVIASGTFDRGRGVQFKLRWTTQQVLEGEKRFRVSFAVPDSWRGGLVDVNVTANRLDRSLFGSSKLRSLSEANFVVAVYQQDDSEAAELALRLAHLDRKLAAYAKQHPQPGANGVTQFWRRLWQPDSRDEAGDQWYQGVTRDRLDPYTDRRIRTLPMPVRVSVLGYNDAVRDLMKLSEAG